MRRLFTFVTIFAILGAWMFSGWPQVWNDPAFPPQVKNALAATKTIEEIRSKIGATGLYYVDLVYLQAHNQVVGRHCCDACFSGQYPIAPLTTTSK